MVNLHHCSQDKTDLTNISDIEEIYMCDKCSRHLILDRDIIFFDVLSNDHFCEACLQDSIQIMKEKGMSQKDIEENVIEVV